jgi:hypothetical protein
MSANAPHVIDSILLLLLQPLQTQAVAFDEIESRGNCKDDHEPHREEMGPVRGSEGRIRQPSRACL